MLRVELRALEHEDLVVDECGAAEALGLQLGPELTAIPLEIHCELSKNGDVILARGWVKGRMALACGRCLRKFENGYKSFFEIHYRPKPSMMEGDLDVEFPSGDVEVVYYDGETLDIGDQVRQTVLLSVPMRAICREDCRGICGGCGADLNVERCQCAEPPGDPRWAGLKEWKPK